MSMLQDIAAVFTMFMSVISLGYIIYVSRKLDIEAMYETVISFAKEDLTAFINQPENQKMLIALGALIGAGARQGAGFGISKGKGGIEGIVAQIFTALLGGAAQQQNINQQPYKPAY